MTPPVDYRQVLTRLQHNAVNKLRYANKRPCNNRTYKVGDAVLLSRGQRHEKFSCEFVGPYVIQALLAHNRYSVRKLGAQKTLKCSKDHLRLWPTDWIRDDFESLLEADSESSLG